ncbi:MAG: hypothetical protein AAFR38_10665 [Planctomycetota bacterium]
MSALRGRDARPAPDEAGELLALNAKILGERQGFERTVREGAPVDAEGRPIPWFTYPAIEYLSRFDLRGVSVFEFGCGHSTLWWRRLGADVWSVEHDAGWCERVRARSEHPDRLMFRDEEAAYAGAIDEASEAQGGPFDIVLVDGVWRNACVGRGLARLADDGMVILDNSDWYADAAATLRGAGFVPIDFSGFGPINPYCWTTSVFWRVRTRLAGRIDPPDPVGGQRVEPGPMW